MSEELIRYNHQRGDTNTWFVQYAKDPVWSGLLTLNPTLNRK